jgi:hypothetical protein
VRGEAAPLRPRAVIGLIALLLVSATTILSAPISLELTGGSVIKGDLVSWNGQQAIVKADFGSLTFKREQLSQATLQRLDLLSGDPQKLVARITELEATVESLRRDNAALRQQLQAALAARTAPAPAPTLPVKAISSTSSSNPPASTGLSYTVSSTGKRHNSRYYGSGRPAGPNEGIPCKICGG